MEIRSPMAGVILRVSVQVEDTVARGQEIAVLESMKMEVPVVADGDGVVDQLLLAAGAFVQEGDVLAVLR